jgi:histidinol-phosphatase
LNDQRVRVSDVSRLADAALSFGNVRSLATGGRSTALAELFRSVDRVRGYGEFYHYHLLAAGKLDIVVESDINILDVAALSVIVQEAGGLTTDIAGKPLSLDSTSILAGTVPLHECVRALLHRLGT